MNNLLRTLTESRVKSLFPEADLKLLLTTVKEGRRQSYDTKLSDPFYDSLEGLLVDLRTVTMDSHDAEAFLKPVSKTDVPDYYDVISNPMDLQTMLKKVKQKQYKSKVEFKDDLDLIWSNCFTYNAKEDHPLRLCATRLKAKADKLLKNITDRKERTDPSIPLDLSSIRTTSSRKVNGIMNGHSRSRSASIPSKSTIKQSTPIPFKRFRRDAPFPETPAIVRTPSGMSTFLQLDREMGYDAGPSYDPDMAQRLKEFSASEEYESEDDNAMSIDGSPKSEVGEKRKLNGAVDHRPRKRARVPHRSSEDDKNVMDLWWNAVNSDSLMGNGLPTLAYASSQETNNVPIPPSSIKSPKKRKRRKPVAPPANTMLTIMNDNIKTLKRVRRTHTKFAALNVNTEEGGSLEEPPEIAGEDVEETVDERPWKSPGAGIELGEENATDCLHWMGGKVLEHAGFQGTSKAALDVLSGVASEYLLNVGRTIRFLCDKYSNSMSAEEIILHTLFESGTTKIQDLERYVKDDVIRYGARLGDLEKKLIGAYREATAVEVLDDDDLFGNEEDEEEEGAFVMGNFADAFGEDFLGLRELGIAAELGMSSLTVPKRLLKGKRKGGQDLTSSAAKPTEPPPPYPPPPSLIPLSSDKLDDQIGLLKPYYHDRFSTLAAAVPAAPAQPTLHPYGYPTGVPFAQFPPPDLKVNPVILPDDSPDPAHGKIGPLGQILKSGPSTAAAKKKLKGKDPAVPFKGLELGDDMNAMPNSVVAGGLPIADSPKKPKKSGGPGPGPGKKKGKVLPPMIMAGS